MNDSKKSMDDVLNGTNKYRIEYESTIGEVDAKAMIQAYHQHSRRLVYFEDGTQKTLYGLVMDKSDVEALHKLNSEKYLILFAVSKGDLENSSIQANKKRLTTILAGINEDNEIEVSDLRNIFEPCPNSCAAIIGSNYYDTFGVIQP